MLLSMHGLQSFCSYLPLGCLAASGTRSFGRDGRAIVCCPRCMSPCRSVSTARRHIPGHCSWPILGSERLHLLVLPGRPCTRAWEPRGGFQASVREQLRLSLGLVRALGSWLVQVHARQLGMGFCLLAGHLTLRKH